MLLALIGVWGVLSQLVRRSRREIEIRMALEASPALIFNRMLAAGLRPAVVGCASGIVLAIAVSRVLGSVPFQISPTDPASYFGAEILLLNAAGLACAAFALRAARTDPVKVLKAD